MIVAEQKQTETKEFRNPDAGNYLGRLFSVIDIGTQTTIWEGQEKQQHKILLNFELFGEDSNGPLEIAGKPLTVYKRYTLSLNEKSTLRADLEAWRGKKLSHEELAGFDLSKLVDKYAMVNVVHNDFQGKTYANISSLAQVPSLIKEFPAGVNEAFLFDLKKFEQAKFDKIWGWQQEMVKKSAEWRNKPDAVSIEDDEVPF
jgi:hypothetical protein